ncbi:unnamed protein product [marine sediment metagenome]|uniref:Uncharacterized protein n=1 Tax=marine sediment metagenome TaxID=412755 RepID=X1CQ65_9ZZZZ
MVRNIQISNTTYKELRILREDKIKITELKVTFDDIISMLLRKRNKNVQ